MKPLAGSKLLYAFLAAVTVGVGLRTYSLVQVRRELDARHGQTTGARADEPQLALAHEPPLAAPGLLDFENGVLKVTFQKSG